MMTINDLRDTYGINSKWTQNLIDPRVLEPKKVGNQWFFFEEETLVIVALWQSRETLGKLTHDTYYKMAVALRDLLERDKRRKGIVYLTLEEASWKPMAPALSLRIGG